MQRFTFLLQLALTLGLAAAALGCGDDSDSSDGASDADGMEMGSAGGGAAADDASIEIAGDWTSEFGDETIDSAMWNDATVVTFDNGDNVAITRNADDAELSPGLYNRIVWTDPESGAFHYCTVDFDLESEDAADASTASADEADLDGEGCGGFPWTRLEAAP
jgi:hypothetical protein